MAWEQWKRFRPGASPWLKMRTEEELLESEDRVLDRAVEIAAPARCEIADEHLWFAGGAGAEPQR